ncbi:MAG: hypothetical protein COC19_05580 [SAR86 cluster bacterium]|uniref:TVP38/TMEM64 family membrane protein n=1 Tax=SAR86 cluster bacterium TaxID=2030880 RepID=A0A2A4MKC2_9GAMM|nr:MAG: hypothetical protein COC19_05580 [SAR86 cluster bacterium]
MKRHFNTLWLVLVALMLASLLLFPELLSRDSISTLLEQFGRLSLLAYVLVSMFRSTLLIPSTPFVLAGAVLFPQWPLAVFIISMLGIVAGAYLVYSFPSFGNYDRLLEQKYPDKIAALKRRMNSAQSFWIVLVWSLFPLVPTDAVCYVAGIAKMPFRKMITALVLGEIPLVTLYVFFGAEFGQWLRI